MLKCEQVFVLICRAGAEVEDVILVLTEMYLNRDEVVLIKQKMKKLNKKGARKILWVINAAKT